MLPGQPRVVLALSLEAGALNLGRDRRRGARGSDAARGCRRRRDILDLIMVPALFSS